MPVINIAMHTIPAQEKATLITQLTRTAAEVTRIPESSFIVLIQELSDEAIGCGGRTLRDLRASTPA